MALRVAVGPSSFAQADGAPLRMLEAAGIEVKPNPFGRRLDEAETIDLLRDVDGLLAGLEPLNRAVFASAAPRLKAIARVGIGMTNVDAEAASDFGVRVSNTPDPPAVAVAEMTMAALLALLRGLPAANARMHAGEWPKTIGLGLGGTKVLLVGYGRIGRRVGRLLRAFGAVVLVCDPHVDASALRDGEIKVELGEGLRQAEAVSLHASGEQTLLGGAEIASMRDGAFLLNSARGELVDEAALAAALRSGKLAGAWFDAFWREPYQGELLDLDNALLTPHMCTYTRQCRLDMETQAVANLLRDLGVAP